MTAYYDSSSHRTHTNIGWILTGLGLFALIWFVAALRERVARERAGGHVPLTVVLVGGTVYVAVAMAGIAIADGIRTMSDDTYHHQVYSGVIHAANDASYILIVTGGSGDGGADLRHRDRRAALRDPAALGQLVRLRRRCGRDLLGHLLHDAGLAAVDRRPSGYRSRSPFHDHATGSHLRPTAKKRGSPPYVRAGLSRTSSKLGSRSSEL